MTATATAVVMMTMTTTTIMVVLAVLPAVEVDQVPIVEISVLELTRTTQASSTRSSLLSSSLLVSASFMLEHPVLTCYLGTDVFLYGIEPLFLSDSPHTPTAMNLTFTLDNVPLEPFVHNGTESSSSDYAQNILVFSQRNLDDKLHVLLVTVQPETSFIFDYMVYTSNNASLASLTTDLPAPTASSIASSGPSCVS